MARKAKKKFKVKRTKKGGVILTSKAFGRGKNKRVVKVKVSNRGELGELGGRPL